MTEMGSTNGDSTFKIISEIVPDFCRQKITQYESTRTGLRAVVVDQEGPRITGYFVLATEIHDDSGAPHTLEHLCFMGSKNYQYKGFLDKLATRSYSSTNAWTDTDNTAYTLDTAGWAGFAQILPIYLEHVILPTLTDAGCTTEVHHIDGEGNDAGVVYSEMQGIENTADNLIELVTKRALYPEGVGFRYETGGMLPSLRVLTAQRIRDFHREMYQPKNLCVMIFGEVDHPELLEILERFETSILDDIPDPARPFIRPWIDSTQTPELKTTTLEKVEFPEEDESMGQIDISFLGPDCADVLAARALGVALQYLSGSPAALLDNVLVEKEQVCSGVYFNTSYRPRTEVQISLAGVQTSRLEQIEKRVFEVLTEAMSKDLDMVFMQDCIDRQIRGFKYGAEAYPTAFSEFLVPDFLFGKRDGSTLSNVTRWQDYSEVIRSWTQHQWKDFIRKYIADAHHVSVLGVPSARLSEKLKAEESARLEEQKKKLGEKGLQRKQEELDQAKEFNDREIPRELLAKFKIPPTDTIHFINTTPARVGPAKGVGIPINQYQDIVDRDGKDFPLFMDFEHIPSNFVRLNLLISTETVPVILRPLLPIYMEAFFNLPIRRGSETIPFEQVVVELERDTVNYNIRGGSSLGNSECLAVTFTVETKHYQPAIDWIKSLLFDSVFDVERLIAVNSRLLADVPEEKRGGSSMLTALVCMAHLKRESINRARETLVKALYLKRIRQQLKRDPDQVIAQFETLRKELCKFGNFRVLVIADLNHLPHPVSSWDSFLKDMDTSHDLNPLGSKLDRLNHEGLNPGSLTYIVPIPTIDSSFAVTLARGPTSYNDPLLPALMVAMAYMNAVEGPLWVAVRGTGLAYGSSMSYDLEAGFIGLDIYRSPDAYKAFEACRLVVQGHMDGSIEFDPLMLEGAISSIVVDFANEQQTLSTAAVDSFIRQVMKGLPADYKATMLRKVRAVQLDEIKESFTNVINHLFDPRKSDVFVTCAPGLKDSIKTGLESVGYKAEIRDLNSFQDDYGFKPYDDDDDGDHDDDDDDDDEDDDEEEDLDGSEGYEMIENHMNIDDLEG